MFGNQISAFEYVSILISIILGLGITQILSALSDLLYHIKSVKFYWPHTLWIVFIMFLHIQDWFVTYQLKDKSAWYLLELLFVLLYPISLFAAAKLLLPTNESEEKTNMKLFYKNQFPVIFFIVAISISLSILFNVFLLKKSILEQVPLLLFLGAVLFISLKKIENEWVHKALSLLIFAGSMISVIIEKEVWVIK